MISEDYLTRFDAGVLGNDNVPYHETDERYFLREAFDVIEIPRSYYEKMLDNTKSFLIDITFDRGKSKKYWKRDLLMLLHKTDGSDKVFSVIINQKYEFFNKNEKYLVEEIYTIMEAYVSKQISMCDRDNESIYYLINGIGQGMMSSAKSKLEDKIESIGLEFRYDSSNSCTISCVRLNGLLDWCRTLFKNNPVRFKEIQKSLDLFVTDHLYDI